MYLNICVRHVVIKEYRRYFALRAWKCIHTAAITTDSYIQIHTDSYNYSQLMLNTVYWLTWNDWQYNAHAVGRERHLFFHPTGTDGIKEYPKVRKVMANYCILKPSSLGQAPNKLHVSVISHIWLCEKTERNSRYYFPSYLKTLW